MQLQLLLLQRRPALLAWACDSREAMKFGTRQDFRSSAAGAQGGQHEHVAADLLRVLAGFQQ